MIQGGTDNTGINHFIEQVKKKDWYNSYSITANYTITDNDKFKELYVTTGAGGLAVTLPDAANNLDRVLRIHKIDSGAGIITIDSAGGAMNSQTAIYLISQWDWIEFKSNGTTWIVQGFLIAYEKGWTVSNDWTNVDLTITHNIDANIRHIDIEIYFSSDGTDGNSFYIPHSNRTLGSSGLNRDYGISVWQDSKLAFHVQTGANGVEYNDDATGASQGVTNGWRYNVFAKRKIIA